MLQDNRRVVKSVLMEIKYKTTKVQKLCENFSFAKKELPFEVAEKLMAHINYIEQATCFSDIMNYPPFKCHKLSGDRKDDYALDVGRKLGYRIIIEPMDENNKSLKKEKDINVIKKCTKIVLVVEVTNHYA